MLRLYPALMSTYLITGANRGIGLEFVRQLAARGDAVVGTVRDTAAFPTRHGRC